MTTNELWTLGIAAYAAVVATLVLGWDAYKWLDAGPKIKVSASTGMQIVGGLQEDTQIYVMVTAVNLGDRATTLTNLGFTYYANWWRAKFGGKPDKAFIITTPSQSQVIPYRLEAGGQWIGIAHQDDEVATMIRSGHLFVVLYHSHAGQGVRKRVSGRGLLS
jgi:hypothetical protein